MEVVNPVLLHLIITIATTHLLESLIWKPVLHDCHKPQVDYFKMGGLGSERLEHQEWVKEAESWPTEKCLSNM